MSSLHKNLKLIHVFSIASGAMISSGIFILPGIAFSQTGPSLFIAYMLAGFVAMIGALSIIELATAMPKAGGDYFFIGRTFGPMAGTITGTLSWLALSLKTAFAIYGLSEIIHILTGIPSLWLGLGLTLFFVLINIKGVEGTVLLEVALVMALIIIMGGFIFSGIPHVNIGNFSPMFPRGFNATLSTTAFVFVSFGGLLQVATIAEEVQNPQKNIQRGTLLSIIIVTFLYGGIIFMTTGTLKAEQFAESTSPVADAAASFLGRPGFIIISAGAALAFITTSLAGILSASRYPLALSRDNLLPPWVGKVSKKSGAPVPAILLTGALIMLALQLDIDLLVKSASAVIILNYISSNIAVIVLRKSDLSYYKPLYKAPFFPYLPLIAVVIYIFLLLDMGWTALTGAGVFMLFSILVYLAYGKKQSSYDFALIHLLKNIVDKKWQEEGLEEELLNIVHQRDMNDDVHDILKGSRCHEITGGMDKTALFERIAQDALEIGISYDIKRLLEERENLFSTALDDFSAVPHLVLQEECPFTLLLYRSKAGIYFSHEKQKIKAVFVLLGSETKRDLHLQTLAALARIMKRKGFRDSWMEAASMTEIQETLLIQTL